MKLSEYRNEDAIDLLADILTPSATIFSDQELWRITKKGRPIDGITYALKHYKKEVIEILARLDNVPVKEYNCNILTLPMRLLDIVNDEELKDFFASQLQSVAGFSFGAATDPTTETAAE